MAIAAFETCNDGLQAFSRRRDHFVHTPDLADDRLWVPYAEGVWFQPCQVNASAGGFAVLLKALPGAKLGKHYHVGAVQGYTLQGTWRYLEHDWVATKGMFIFEPPGEAHTLVIPEDAKEPMLAFFVVSGGLVYVDEAGGFLAYEDGFSLLKLVREHYRQVGIDASRVDALIR